MVEAEWFMRLGFGVYREVDRLARVLVLGLACLGWVLAEGSTRVRGNWVNGFVIGLELLADQSLGPKSIW